MRIYYSVCSSFFESRMITCSSELVLNVERWSESTFRHFTFLHSDTRIILYAYRLVCALLQKKPPSLHGTFDATSHNSNYSLKFTPVHPTAIYIHVDFKKRKKETRVKGNMWDMVCIYTNNMP